MRAFERSLAEGVDRAAAPSVAYGVARGREVLLLGAAGLADVEAGVAATARTPYALASITKPMTATLVMREVEEDRVDLDAPIERYLGGAALSPWAGDPKEATVRRVLNHTAGLPLHHRFYYEDEPWERTPFEETVRRYGVLVSPPGARHHYSNLGYGLLDRLIARVEGVEFGEAMRRRLFEPLGMDRSSTSASPDTAVSYGRDGVAYPRYGTDHPGGSAAYASVEDLLAFGRLHLGHGPGLLSDATRIALQRPTLGYGLGWGVGERFGRRVVGHTGGMGGVRTALRLVPELDLVVAVLVNGESDLPFRAVDDAVAALDEGFRAGLRAERAEGPAPRRREPVPEPSWGVWSGRVVTHRGELPFALEIRDGAEALARLDGQESLVDGLEVSGGRLLGAFDGDVGTEDAGRRPYRLHLDLGVGEALVGAVAAITRVESPGGAPGRRLGDALSYRAELGRWA